MPNSKETSARPTTANANEEENTPILLRLPDELHEYVIKKKRKGENRQDVIKEIIRKEEAKNAA